VTREELRLDMRHAGRVLRGKLVVPAVAMTSAMSIMEDERGRLLKLAVYNALPSGAPDAGTLAAASALLPEGATVAVLEPFYKRFADGTLGVRVDDPRDLVLLAAPGAPAGGDPAALKEQGNAAFRAGRPADAELRYSEALRALDASGFEGASLLSPTLANLAASLLGIGGDEGARGALLVASVAAAVDSGYAKARFRAAAACKALGDARHVRLCVEETCRLGAGGASCDALVANLPPAEGTPGDESSFALAVSAAADGDAHESLHGLALGGADAAADAAAADASTAHKARGNEHFAAGRHAEAAAAYVAALQPQRPAAATLLCNRAAVWLELRRPSAALLDALAALTLRPDTAKAHYRRVLALQALQAPDASVAAAVARGLIDCPGDVALLQLQHGGSDAAGARDARGQQPRARDARRRDGEPKVTRLSEREDFKTQQAGCASVKKVAAMNALMEKLPPAMRERVRAQGLALDDRVSPFHTEFERARAWPAGCDTVACRHKLLGAYEHCRSAPRFDGMAMLDPARSVKPHEMLQRLGSNHPAALMWMQNADTGAVRDYSGDGYDSRVFHSFSNADSSSLVMTPGTAHVAVGFVDLGTLRSAGFDANHARPGPLRWVGVESSSYAVAKTAVVDAMLRATAPVDAILEVWFSAAWSTATLAAFRAAVNDLLQHGGADNERSARPRHPDVAALLATWHTAAVPLAQARATWLEDNSRTWFEIGNFSRKEDRHALCAYALTGQLLDGATVGSVCMFASLPPGFGATRALSESVFHSVPVDELWACRNEGAPDVVAAAAEHLRRGVRLIRDRVEAGEVTIELWLEHLSLNNRAALARICALRPFSVSWSNVCDYATFGDFHAMARACSAPGGEDTIHYGYSMNWPRATNGASVLDYMILDKEHAVPHLQGLHDAALELMSSGFDIIGAKPYLLWPPVTDMRNHVDWLLHAVKEPPLGLCVRWSDAFFAAARLDDLKKQVGLLKSSMLYGHLTRCNGALHFTYTYDPDLRMVPFSPGQGEPPLNVHISRGSK
jgi:tetratricopeptide (TPR) repeat protein